jgi:hypothetical protein
MNITIKAKLITLLPKLLKLGMVRYGKLLEQFPEAKTRSAVLVLYDDHGNRIAFWGGFEDDSLVFREVDPRNPPPCTTMIEMHVNTFIAILKGELDFRTAYIHDLIDIKSFDGLPASYHLLIWAAFFDKAVELLK